MTAVAANETTLDLAVDVAVEVRFTPAGTPLAVRHEGRIWAVAAEPVHWFDRDSWWETRRTAAVGSGDLVSIASGRTPRCARSRCAGTRSPPGGFWKASATRPR